MRLSTVYLSHDGSARAASSLAPPGATKNPPGTLSLQKSSAHVVLRYTLSDSGGIRGVYRVQNRRCRSDLPSLPLLVYRGRYRRLYVHFFVGRIACGSRSDAADVRRSLSGT